MHFSDAAKFCAFPKAFLFVGGTIAPIVSKKKKTAAVLRDRPQGGFE
jgi:hypothetical protein